jgi:hypothetical protein
MDPVVLYYRRQAGCGLEDIGSIYSTPFVQRRHGLGNVLAGLFRTPWLILWSGAKSIDKETLKLWDARRYAQALILLEILPKILQHRPQT